MLYYMFVNCIFAIIYYAIMAFNFNLNVYTDKSISNYLSFFGLLTYSPYIVSYLEVHWLFAVEYFKLTGSI